MFLTKQLLIDWRAGEQHFMQNLIDGDLASNNGGWQWSASTGTDAVPYFRIFNPVTQGQKFDPDGNYVRRFIPEIAGLPNRFLHNPWQAPEAVLAITDIELGSDYPYPIVDLKASRELALAAFQSLR